MRCALSPHTRTSTRRFLPQLEGLERRDCPTVRIFADGAILTVLGDRAADAIAITDDGAGNVAVTADGKTVNAAGIGTVRVRTEAGNDSLTYTLTGALAGSRLVSIDMVKENDTAHLDFTRGVASGGLTVQLQGNDGIDSLSADVGAVAAAALADVQVNGGTGDDVISTAFAGSLFGSLNLKGSGQDGHDTVTSNLTLDPGSTGRLDTSVRGGKGNDRLTLRVHDVQSRLAFREATLDGDEGIDTWTATENVRVRNCEIRA